MIDPNFYAKIRQKIAEHGERIAATVKNTAEQEEPKPKPRRGRPPKQYADNSPEAKRQAAQKRCYDKRKDDPEFRKKRNEASLKWYYEHKKTEQKDEP